MFEKLGKWFSPSLNFPPKTTGSLEDAIRSEKQSIAGSGAGKVAIYASWSDEMEHRPFDIPMYTAIHDSATILVYISSGSIADGRDLEKIFREELPWTLHMSAFLDGPYPVLRFTLSVPDDPANPLMLETPLDIRMGDIQAFCEAALRKEQIDLIVSHESVGSDNSWAASYRCKGIAKLLRREVNQAAAKLQPVATEEDFNKSVRRMEAKFQEPSAGIDDAAGIQLVFAGPARNRSINA